jgi:hypothetical protein
MSNMIKEDEIRLTLNKIRKLTLEQDSGLSNTRYKFDIDFDEIDASLKLMSNEELSDEIKQDITDKIEVFIKSSGLMINFASAMITSEYIKIKISTIKNPGVEVIKSITFDTRDENPTMDLISGEFELNKDFISFINAVNTAYYDNQVGRNALASSLLNV